LEIGLPAARDHPLTASSTAALWMANCELTV